MFQHSSLPTKPTTAAVTLITLIFLLQTTTTTATDYTATVDKNYNNPLDTNDTTLNSDNNEPPTSEEEIHQLYRNRSIPFSILTTISIVFNIISFIAIIKIRGPRTVYNAFLANLAIGDTVGAMLLWMFHNSLLIFPSFEEEYDQDGGGGVVSLKICLFKCLGLLVPILLATTNSILALLLLALNQFIAICYPLLAQTRFIPEKAWLVVLLTWIVAFLVATTPATIIGILASVNGCTVYKDRTNLPVEISVCLLAVLVLVVVVLYARVYAEVVKCRKRSFMLSNSPTKSTDSGKIMTSSSFFQQQQQQLQTNLDKPSNKEVACSSNSHRIFNKKEVTVLPKRQKKSSVGQQVQFQLTKHQPQRHYDASSENNYKAFLTTLILAGALLLFWLPYLIISSINTNYATEFLFKLKFFVFDILPMLTYISDPIIYGVRIRSVRLSYRRVYGPIMTKICCGWKLFCCCNKKSGRRKYVSTKNELSIVNATEKARNGNEISMRMTSVQDLSACQ